MRDTRPRPAGPTDAPGLAARVAAATVLGRVLGERQFLEAAEAREAGRLARLAPRDRAFAHRLTRACLRRLGSVDAAIDAHLEQPLPAAAAGARTALRLAVTETRVLGGPAHAAVDAAVTLARRAAPRFAGLVNAVARKIAAEPPPDAEAEARAAFALDTPAWLGERLVAAYGRAQAEAIAAAHARGAALDLTPREPSEAAALAAALGGVVTPTGSIRLAPSGPIAALEGYAEGRWWVQDAAAALPARWLAARPGERVADLCAAPGGKTAQLAAAGAEVIALDASADRLARVGENLSRLRLSARLIAADARAWRPEAPLDAVIVDAPCTATGTLRRHPDLAHVKSAADIAEGLPGLLALQDALLDAAWAMLRPGGRLVYCTCSLLPEEGAARVGSFLTRRPDAWRAAAPADGFGAPEFFTDAALRTLPSHWPGAGGVDGFFAARLDKLAPDGAAR